MQSVGDGAATPRAAAPTAGAHAPPTSRLMVLLFSDIVGSTDLKNRLGTVEYAELLSRHDQIFRQIIESTPGAHILKDTGDGFFASFATASDAVRAALRFQFGLSRRAKPLQARVGLHLGEVAELELETTGLPKLVGLAADFAARLMSLASGGQILMTRVTFNDARQFVRAHPGVDGDGDAPELRWVAHGEYLIQGADEPVEIFEVGAVGVAPLSPPADSVKARRNVRPGDELTLGWRPGSGLAMRGRQNWIIKQKLGEGGFGEVWLAEHTKTGTRRVFKFCFEPARLRGLKREVVLFRLLREALGDRRDIARIIDFQFDESPYFIETEFFPAGTLVDWAASRGGIARIPLAERVEIVAKVAEALAAAHGVGVLHKDLKPSNILMRDDGQGFYPCITDFGIGILTDRSQLEKHDITTVGFTQSDLTENESSRTGTRLYAPPESLLNKPFTVQGDVYALGVLLYQMVVGDLDRPLAEGWERAVDDPLLRDDIAACVEGDASRRLPAASELSGRLRSLDERRAQRDARRNEIAASRRRATLLRLTLPTVAALIVLSSALAAAVYQRSRRLGAEALARREAEAARDRVAAEKEKATASAAFLESMLTAADPQHARGADLRVRDLLDTAAARVDRDGAGRPEVEVQIRAAIGNAYYNLGLWEAAEPHLSKAADLAQKTYGEGAEWATRLGDLAVLKHDQGDFPVAEKLYRRALDLQRAAIGPDGENALKTENNLAQLLLDTGRYAEAERSFQRVLDVRRRTLGGEHLETADCMRQLAHYYRTMANYPEAERLFKEVLAIREEQLGPDHPHTIGSVEEMAQLYDKWGRNDLAEPLYQRALAMAEKIWGANHPTTATYLSNMGLAYDRAGKYAEAEAAYRRALEIRESALGKDHVVVAATLSNLAMVYRASNRTMEATAMLSRALSICEKAYGPDHDNTATVLNNLAAVYDDTGDYTSAEPLYKRALEIRTKSFGPDHPDTAVCGNNLGLLYLNTGRYAEAEPLLTHVIEVLKKVNGLENADTATTMGNLAMLYERTGRTEQAEALHRQALEIRRKVQGPDHPNVAVSLNNLATIAGDRSDYAEADRDFVEAIRIMSQAYGEAHRQTLHMQLNRAIMLKKAGRLSEAAAVLRTVTDLARRAQSAQQVLQALAELSDVARRAGNAEEAAKLARDVVDEAAHLPDAAQREKWAKAAAELAQSASTQSSSTQPASTQAASAPPSPQRPDASTIVR
jgi:serine/threonine-protein kinase